MSRTPTTRTATTTAELLRSVGKKMRIRRAERGYTLQTVANQTGISAAMLSLVERGKTAPSVGTLVAISSVLDLRIPEILGNLSQDEQVLTKLANQSVIKNLHGVLHRVVTDDNAHGLQITVNQYPRSSSNSPEPITHDGFEYGLVLDGKLEVTVDGKKHLLDAGDLISYRSSQPHRIVNRSTKRATAIWINLRTP
jgi:transcriptional regulator with XRE-family HTH domain